MELLYVQQLAFKGYIILKTCALTAITDFHFLS